jgi:hypothetical protein
MMSQLFKLFTIQTHFVFLFPMIGEPLTQDAAFLGEFPSVIVIRGITNAIEDLGHIEANGNASSILISAIQDKFGVVYL